MAILDDKLVLCDAQDVPTAVGGSANSENYIDLGDATQMPGRGTPLFLNVVVNTAIAGTAGASKLQVALQHSADGSSWASKVVFAAQLVDALATPGVKIAAISLPQEDMERYINLALYTETGLTSGKIDAWISLEAPARGPEDTTTYGAISGQ
jgi:hypothetical protein